MAVLNYSNAFFASMMRGEIDLDNDTIQMILMNDSFVFNPDTHDQLSNVSSSELAAGNGYTAGGVTMTTPSVTEDDTNDRARLTFDNVVFTASGGSIGPSAGAIIYDDTQANDVLIGYLPFSQTRTVTDGNDLTIETITIDFSQAP